MYVVCSTTSRELSDPVYKVVMKCVSAHDKYNYKGWIVKTIVIALL